MISPVFKDLKNGDYKIISFYAKRARGLMARFIVETDAQSVTIFMVLTMADTNSLRHFQSQMRRALSEIRGALRTISPDSIIAPWLETIQPSRLWVIGTSSPSVVRDYQIHTASQVAVLDPAEICSSMKYRKQP